MSGVQAHPNQDESRSTIDARYLIEGAETLEDAAVQLRIYASMLQHLHERGWRLAGPPEGNQAVIVHSSEAVA